MFSCSKRTQQGNAGHNGNGGKMFLKKQACLKSADRKKSAINFTQKSLEPYSQLLNLYLATLHIHAILISHNIILHFKVKHFHTDTTLYRVLLHSMTSYFSV